MRCFPGREHPVTVCDPFTIFYGDLYPAFQHLDRRSIFLLLLFQSLQLIDCQGDFLVSVGHFFRLMNRPKLRSFVAVDRIRHLPAFDHFPKLASCFLHVFLKLNICLQVVNFDPPSMIEKQHRHVSKRNVGDSHVPLTLAEVIRRNVRRTWLSPGSRITSCLDL